MLASAVCGYLKAFAVAPGRRAVVFTNNDSAYETALALARAGVEIVMPAGDASYETRRALAEEGAVETALVCKALKDFGIKSDRPDPLYS